MKRLDQAALGLPDTVFIDVMTERHEEEPLRRFEAGAQAIPEHVECHLVTGEYDHVIKAAAGGTMGDERLARDRSYRLPGMRHMRTSFALRCLKQDVSPVPWRTDPPRDRRAPPRRLQGGPRAGAAAASPRLSPPAGLAA